MSDYIETLWSQFFIETQEHLELIEPLLVEAEHNALQKEDVDQLFRSFHSIKGLSKSMDLLGMEAIAHRAEDILGLVRDGVIVVEAELADVLLVAIDALKQHHHLAELERKDQPPATALITTLINTYKNAIDGVTVKPDVEVGKQSIVADNQATDIPVATNSPSTVEGVKTGLHDDPELLLFFCELLQSNLPKLADLLVPTFSSKSESWVDVVDTLETLGHASGTMEFLQLSEQFSTVRKLLPKKSKLKKSARNALIEALIVLVDFVRLIEKETQNDCALQSLIKPLKLSVSKKIECLFTQLNDRLQKFGIAFVGVDDFATNEEGDILVGDIEQRKNVVDKWVEITEASQQLRKQLHIFDDSNLTQRLLLTVSEVSDRIVEGQLVPQTDLIALLGDAIVATETQYANKGINKEACSTSSEWQALHDRIWAAVEQQDLSDSNEGLLSFAELTELIEINPSFETSLSSENIRLVQEWLKDDSPVYQALVNLEQSEEFNAGFLQWVEENVQVVTSRAVLIDEQPWCEFLLLSRRADHELRESLKGLDGQRQYITIACCQSVENNDVEGNSTEPFSAANSSARELSVLRVSGATLDQFMSQIGEMVSIRGLLNHTVHAEDAVMAINQLKKKIGESDTGGNNGPGFNQVECMAQLEVLEKQQAAFDQIDQKLHAVLGQLQDNALALRVVPMETVFKRFPRTVRDLAQAQGKKVKLEMAGQDVRIDKAMVEALSDPLMHMVRNSVDHGIETMEEREVAGKAERAVVSLEARQQGNTVKVIITDDGRGIDVGAVRDKAVEKGLASEEELQGMSSDEIMQYIFAPGFSTAAQITETSGRGVGMDVVRTNVTRMGGNVSVSSVAGRGSCFTLELPLSAAIQDTLLVKASGHMMAIPERYVTEMIEVKRQDLQWVKGCQAVVLRGNFLPVYRLGPLLGYRGGEQEGGEEQVVVVLSDGKQRIGVIIDRSYQRQELFIKDIHEQLAALPGVSGASILGDGRVVLILDVEDLLNLAARRGREALLETASSLNQESVDLESAESVLQESQVA